ncbi:MAG: hypothetical protein WBA16_09515 [Nonlabens sp.]
MGRYFINCGDANILSTRNQYRDLNRKDLFRFKLHKTHCWGCRSFDKENDLLQRRLKKAQWVSLSKTQKQSIKDRVNTAFKEL